MYCSQTCDTTYNLAGRYYHIYIANMRVHVHVQMCALFESSLTYTFSLIVAAQV